MYTLLALGIMPSSTDGELIPMSYSNGEDLKHVKGQFIQRELGKNGIKSLKENNESEETDDVQDDTKISKELGHQVLSKLSFTDD